jgi:hemerythrin superfamily protein
MVTTLDDAKRNAIGMKLSDMAEIQKFLIESEQKYISEIADDDIRDRLRNMLQDDQKNLGIIETVIVQYGVKADPKQTTLQMVEMGRKMSSSSDFSMLEKLAQHELLKHSITMMGLLVHKCAQVVGADVEAAITPLNTVNFENRAHQEQLKGILEKIGVRELTGKEADQGLWGRVQDAVAALSGVAGSVLTQNTDRSDMTLQDILRMDHQKVNVLFAEIMQTNDPMKRREYFGQLYKDLRAHALAEDEIAYPAVRGKYPESDLQELYNEQDSWLPKLDQMAKMDMMSEQFMNEVRQLMSEVQDHVRQEESTFFASVRDNFSKEEQERLGSQFKAKKSQLQDEMKASMSM